MKKLFLPLTFLLITSLSTYAAPVDVNTANAEVLAESLAGVGPKIAEAIVEYRKEHGPYQSVNDLLNIKGIGPKVLEKNKNDILLGEKTRRRK